MNAEYYQLLNEFLSFKTVSTLDKEFEKEHKKCCEWLKELFLKNWFKSEIIGSPFFPSVVAKYETNIDAETCLIYWNYDVPFADKFDWWKDEPFSLYFWKDKIFWRWVADGKWMLLVQMLTVFKLIQENNLKYNVIFLIDGEKSLWSPNLKNFFSENKIVADFVFSSIGTSIQNIPVVNTSFKWWFNSIIEIKTANKVWNIWQYWSVFPNSAHEVWKLLSKLYDSNSQITIPYFYYEVENISVNEKTINSRIPFDNEWICNSYWIKSLKLNDIDYYSKIWWQSDIEVVWIKSGCTKYIMESIPNISEIGLNFKLVPNQKVESIKKLFEEWLKSNLLCEYCVSYFWESDPVKIDVQNWFVDKVKSLLSDCYLNKIYQVSSWFTYPLAKIFQNCITQKIINIPFLNIDSDINWVNENFDIELLEKWSEFLYEFFRK